MRGGGQWLKRDKEPNQDRQIRIQSKEVPSSGSSDCEDYGAHLLDGGQDPRFPLVRPVRSDTQVDLVRVLVGDVTSGELEDAAMASDTARKIGSCYVARS